MKAAVPRCSRGPLSNFSGRSNFDVSGLQRKRAKTKRKSSRKTGYYSAYWHETHRPSEESRFISKIVKRSTKAVLGAGAEGPCTHAQPEDGILAILWLFTFCVLVASLASAGSYFAAGAIHVVVYMMGGVFKTDLDGQNSSKVRNRKHLRHIRRDRTESKGKARTFMIVAIIMLCLALCNAHATRAGPSARNRCTKCLKKYRKVSVKEAAYRRRSARRRERRLKTVTRGRTAKRGHRHFDNLNIAGESVLWGKGRPDLTKYISRSEQTALHWRQRHDGNHETQSSPKEMACRLRHKKRVVWAKRLCVAFLLAWIASTLGAPSAASAAGQATKWRPLSPTINTRIGEASKPGPGDEDDWDFDSGVAAQENEFDGVLHEENDPDSDTFGERDQGWGDQDEPGTDECPELNESSDDEDRPPVATLGGNSSGGALRDSTATAKRDEGDIGWHCTSQATSWVHARFSNSQNSVWIEAERKAGLVKPASAKKKHGNGTTNKKNVNAPNVEGDFTEANKFHGTRPGYCYKTGQHGTGYYREAGIEAAAPTAAGETAFNEPDDGTGITHIGDSPDETVSKRQERVRRHSRKKQAGAATCAPHIKDETCVDEKRWWAELGWWAIDTTNANSWGGGY